MELDGHMDQDFANVVGHLDNIKLANSNIGIPKEIIQPSINHATCLNNISVAKMSRINILTYCNGKVSVLLKS